MKRIVILAAVFLCMCFASCSKKEEPVASEPPTVPAVEHYVPPVDIVPVVSPKPTVDPSYTETPLSERYDIGEEWNVPVVYTPFKIDGLIQKTKYGLYEADLEKLLNIQRFYPDELGERFKYQEWGSDALSLVIYNEDMETALFCAPCTIHALSPYYDINSALSSPYAESTMLLLSCHALLPADRKDTRVLLLIKDEMTKKVTQCIIFDTLRYEFRQRVYFTNKAIAYGGADDEGVTAFAPVWYIPLSETDSSVYADKVFVKEDVKSYEDYGFSTPGYEHGWGTSNGFLIDPRSELNLLGDTYWIRLDNSIGKIYRYRSSPGYVDASKIVFPVGAVEKKTVIVRPWIRELENPLWLDRTDTSVSEIKVYENAAFTSAPSDSTISFSKQPIRLYASAEVVDNGVVTGYYITYPKVGYVKLDSVTQDKSLDVAVDFSANSHYRYDSLHFSNDQCPVRSYPSYDAPVLYEISDGNYGYDATGESASHTKEWWRLVTVDDVSGWLDYYSYAK